MQSIVWTNTTLTNCTSCLQIPTGMDPILDIFIIVCFASQGYPHFLTQPHSPQLQNDMSRGPDPQKSQYHPAEVDLNLVSDRGRDVVHASHDWAESGLRSVHVGHDHSASSVRSITSVSRVFLGGRIGVGRAVEVLALGGLGVSLVEGCDWMIIVGGSVVARAGGGSTSILSIRSIPACESSSASTPSLSACAFLTSSSTSLACFPSVLQALSSLIRLSAAYGNGLAGTPCEVD